MRHLFHFAIFCIFCAVSTHSFAQTIKVQALSVAPELDGSDSDWQDVTAAVVPLHGKMGLGPVTVKSGVHGDDVFFLFQWDDEHEDILHKPFIWDPALEKYVVGKQREDRFSINFAMRGDFTHDWLSGKELVADMWHWKGFRSNTLGLAHDKTTIITRDKPSEPAYEAILEDGTRLYFLRPADAGTPLYKTIRYSTKQDDIMPKYVLSTNPSGSVADVKAKGVWHQGKWTLEMKRKFDTGNVDDVIFVSGQQIKSAIAVFNRSGDDQHDVSETLVFQF